MQYVALWYKHGDPVFGRAYPSAAGKTMAHFGKNNQENAGPEVGSMQLLTVPEASCMGLEYKWMPLAEGKSSGWTVVHIGNAAPCILKDEKGIEVLGNLDLTIEKASAGFGGKEKIMSGAPVAGLKVLFKRRLN
uniref:Lipocalin-like domain-containing protein n=1 Tax=Caenorhabditis tropicalis TaxID=1561998 RepID=A0A1I7UL19_9PELO